MKKLVSKNFKFVAASLAVIASLFVMAAAPAVALAAAPAAATPAAAGTYLGPFAVSAIAKRYTDAELSAMFQHDQTWFRNLQAADKAAMRLSLPANVTADEKGAALAKTDSYLSAKGIDLTRDVTLFKDIQALITAHAGFAANGDVSNRAMADQTLSMLESLLRNAEFWLARAQISFDHAHVAR